MYTGFQHLHSWLSYLVLAGILLSILFAMHGYFTKKEFGESDRKKALFGLIPAHLQWAFGFILYFLSPLGFTSLSSEAMGNAMLRLYTVEHPITMILAVVLITVGFVRAKRGTDSNKRFLNIWGFYLVGLILIISRIPWANWP